MFSAALLASAQSVLDRALSHEVHVITAESCTGGLIAAALTEVPGASSVILGGLITYADEAKMELLGVPEALLAGHGAVSEAVAKAMSEGAVLAGRHMVEHGKGIVAVAVTGIAGPGGGTPQKPVGTVHLAVRHYPSHTVRHECVHFKGDRNAIRRQTVEKSLAMLQAMLAEL